MYENVAPIRALDVFATEASLNTVRLIHGTASITLATNNPAVQSDVVDYLYAYDLGGETVAENTEWRVVVLSEVPNWPGDLGSVFVSAEFRQIDKGHMASVIRDGPTEWLFVADVSVAFRISHSTQELQLFCADTALASNWGHKIVRQLITAQLLLQADAVLSHAAAVDYGGDGVLVMGYKGSGKTTTMLALHRLLGCKFVSNDLVVLVASEDDVEAFAYPSVLLFGPGTLQSYPALRGLVSTSMVGSLSDKGSKLGVGVRGFFPRDAVAGSCTPRLLLLPTVQSKSPGARIEILDRDTTLRELLRHEMYMTSENVADWIQAARMQGNPSRKLRRVARKLVDNTICCRLQVGSDPEALAVALRGFLANSSRRVSLSAN